ncbi:DUF429 domain-containing protein [Undibacterium sp. Jales W-56]|uniref:DUF429 domain-containing protein n=1 Tax=Undibacterium sp. Jales W-56 TaxID=2897325 RepID=UPI0021D336DE|nr:DUF429 domain-containing protein [Undibacterium sp. Jales W-56]MCU6432292.1 DUF429 domain-containing protein [Undibacterium sp. Jales W-56]
MRLYGVDFTSAPGKRKAITIAGAVLHEQTLVLQSLTALRDFAAFDAWLMRPGPWLAGFDLPFSLPRELVEHLGWPQDWAALVQQLENISRAGMRCLFKAFCDARPSGNKFAHRATDIPARSSPSMKWVNPPVAYMLHAGAPRLLRSGLVLPGMHGSVRPDSRIALEAYPGMLARSITQASYKSDDRRKQTPERLEARRQIIAALELGATPWRIRVDCAGFRQQLLDDGSGDLLDALLCAVLAAWGWQRRDANYGLPAFDALEGWIVGAGLGVVGDV